jgi:hypothetical protein
MFKRKDKTPATPFRLQWHQEDKFVPYVMKIELGILQASKIDPTLNDQQIKESLRQLMRAFKRSSSDKAVCDAARARGIATSVKDNNLPPIVNNLAQALEENGPLPVEDIVGVISTARSSISAWSVGHNSQTYLAFLEQFFADLGIIVEVTAPAPAPDHKEHSDDDR